MRSGSEVKLKLRAEGTQLYSELARAKKSVSEFSSFTSTLRRIALPALSVGALVGLGKMADDYTLLDNKLRLVTATSEELEAVQKGLYEQSLRSHSSYESSVDLYSRFARATQTLGVGQEQLLRITETLNKAMIISGATQEESKNAIIQLSQGMASGVLRGEEFNSIMENGARVAKMLSDYLGVDIGTLRSLAKEGKITSSVMVNAFTAATGTIEGEFAKMEPTISQAMTDLTTVFGKLVSDSNKGATGTRSVAAEIKKLADTIDRHREGIIELFVRIISLAGKAASALGNIGQSFRGWAAVKEGRLSFTKFAGMNADDLKVWLAENDTGLKKLEFQLGEVNKKISAMTGPLANQFGLVSQAELAKLMAERTRLEEAIRKAQSSPGASPVKEFPELTGGRPDKAASEAAKKHAEAVQKVIKSLEFERDQMTRTDREKAIAIALDKAGESAATRYGQKIAELAGANYDLGQEAKAAKEESDAMVKAMGDWEKEKQAAIDAIEKEIQAIEEEAATYGMSQREITVWRLALQGATDDEIARAKAIMSAIDKMERIKEITESLITPQETYNAAIAELTDLLASGGITYDQYARGAKKAMDELNESVKKDKDEFDDLKRAIEGWGKDSAKAITEFALTGKTSFSDMTRSIIADMMQMIIYQKMLAPLFTSISGFDWFKSVGSVFTGGASSPAASQAAQSLAAAGGPMSREVTVTVNDYNQSAVSAGATRNASGGLDIELVVENIMARKLGQANSRANQAIQQNYNVSQRLTRR